jgi:predicted dehydrogenase
LTRWPQVHVYDDYEALIQDANIDAIYIPLPNSLHVEWVKKAARAGKHVLCEKPIALAAAEIDDLIRLRDETGLLIAEAYMIVHHPQWQLARSLVQDGTIGDLVHVMGAFSYNNAQDTTNIRNDPALGGGAIPDIGVYTYGSTRFVTGQEPKEILMADIHWENGVDVWSTVQADFGKFKATLTNSMRMAARQVMTFHGSHGHVQLTAPFNPSVYDQAEVTLETQDGGRQTWRFPAVNHYVEQLQNFAKTVNEGADYPCPLEFSQGTQAMIDRVFAKARG